MGGSGFIRVRGMCGSVRKVKKDEARETGGTSLGPRVGLGLMVWLVGGWRQVGSLEDEDCLHDDEKQGEDSHG
jgi:hypothetical protein